jgi:enoyl-CoA hydratase/carnithine racemase
MKIVSTLQQSAVGMKNMNIIMRRNSRMTTTTASVMLSNKFSDVFRRNNIVSPATTTRRMTMKSVSSLSSSSSSGYSFQKLNSACDDNTRMTKMMALQQRQRRQPSYVMSFSSQTSSSEPQIVTEKIYINDDDKENHTIVSSSTAIPAITKLVLNRPKANAMGYQFVHSLRETIQEINNNSTDVRCVVVTSYSNKVFSAGADLKERATLTIEQTEEFVTLLRNTMNDLSTLKIPVIVAIEGVAVGGGLELALAGDLRIAGSNATVGLPETSLGIIPGAGGTQRLSRLTGISRAKQLIWTGRKITADEAYQYGIVDEVVPAGTATDRAIALGLEIAKNGPIAIQASKEAIMKGLECQTMTEALEMERQCYAKTLPTKDRLEGLAAFKEGRQPNYKGE